jgi:hypothetical protein
MIYETPELTVLTFAITAIRGSIKCQGHIIENFICNEMVSAYEEWE